MQQRQFFTDNTSADLTYAAETTVDTDFDPQNAETIVLDSKWNEFFGTDEYVTFDATVAQPIVQNYFYDGELQQFRKPEDELKEAQAQIDNLPWTVGHPEKKRVTNSEEIRGFWSDPHWNDGQQATLYVPANDSDAVRFAVQNDGVSIGFGGSLEWVDGEPYDANQRNFAYDHIASVENGRCSPEDGCEILNDSTDPHGHTISSVEPLGSTAEDVVADAVQTEMTEEGQMDGEMNPKYSEGDWVRWEWSDGTAIGQVESVHTDGPVSVSGTSRDPSEKGEPVYKINHWVADSRSESATETTSSGSREDEQKGSFGNTKIAYESNLNSASAPQMADSAHKENETYNSAQHRYETKEDAREAAAEIGCDGVHKHESDDGNTYWMPCSSMEQFEEMVDSCRECSYGPCSCGRHVSLTIDAVVDAESLDELDLTPPQAAQDAAQTALDLREDTDAMRQTGWDRAEQLAAGEELAPADISDGTDGMANWWARHESHTVTLDGESLKRDESVSKADDHSWVAGKGWGGIAGMNWAMRMDEKITEIRGEETNDAAVVVQLTDESTIMDTITYDGLMGGDLDESEIPNEGYEPHYVFDADTKTASSYPLVDGDGNLRRGNVKAAWELYGQAEDEQFLLAVLAQANDRFANADGMSAPIPDDSLQDAMTDTMTADSLQEFIDSNDLTDEQVIDKLGIDVPESPTDFYDSEPDVETLADDFTAVEALQDSKESLEEEVEELNDELQSYRVDDFRDSAERLAELVDSRDVETMVEQFEDGELTVDDVDEQITVAEEAIGSTTTTVSTDSDVETDSEPDIETTDSGRYDLRQNTKVGN